MNDTGNAPENTSTRPPELHLLGMLSDSSGYITGMEAEGQRQLVASAALPKHGPWDELIALGFTRGDDVDDLFVNATLPAGWTKHASDHAMGSYIADQRGIDVVSIFYKAAFYDRKADMHLVNVGYMASTHVLYGDEPVALPEHWDAFTADERDDFSAGLAHMDDQIADCPQVYSKYAERLAAARALFDGASS